MVLGKTQLQIACSLVGEGGGGFVDIGRPCKMNTILYSCGSSTRTFECSINHDKRGLLDSNAWVWFKMTGESPPCGSNINPELSTIAIHSPLVSDLFINGKAVSFALRHGRHFPPLLLPRLAARVFHKLLGRQPSCHQFKRFTGHLAKVLQAVDDHPCRVFGISVDLHLGN